MRIAWQGPPIRPHACGTVGGTTSTLLFAPPTSLRRASASPRLVRDRAGTDQGLVGACTPQRPVGFAFTPYAPMAPALLSMGGQPSWNAGQSPVGAPRTTLGGNTGVGGSVSLMAGNSAPSPMMMNPGMSAATTMHSTTTLLPGNMDMARRLGDLENAFRDFRADVARQRAESARQVEAIFGAIQRLEQRDLCAQSDRRQPSDFQAEHIFPQGDLNSTILPSSRVLRTNEELAEVVARGFAELERLTQLACEGLEGVSAERTHGFKAVTTGIIRLGEGCVPGAADAREGESTSDVTIASPLRGRLNDLRDCGDGVLSPVATHAAVRGATVAPWTPTHSAVVPQSMQAHAHISPGHAVMTHLVGSPHGVASPAGESLS